jgi:predicted acetyltransferase
VSLVLRALGPDDEEACVVAAGEFEDFPFLLFWKPGTQWADYVDLLAGLRDGSRVPEGLVRSAFLLAEVDGELVGRVSIRLELNEYLAARGGHIGYGVRPDFRRRGFATEILRQAVMFARDEGIDRILVVCDDHNAASAGVIERCGGVLEAVVSPDDGDVPFRRYWIN